MSSVLKKEDADRLAFKFQPKKFQLEPSQTANDFVVRQEKSNSEFRIADVVAQQSGVKDLQKKNIEAQVDESVLVRMKEIEESAYKKSYELGLLEGRERAYVDQSEEISARLSRFDLLNQKMDDLMVNVMKESEAAMLKLVFQIAKRIAFREIKADQWPIVDLLKQLVDQIQSANHIHVRLSPGDFKFIEELRLKTDKAVEPLNRVRLESRDDIQTGGCLIETEYGAIDGTIEQRVDMAWHALEAKLPNIGQTGGATD